VESLNLDGVGHEGLGGEDLVLLPEPAVFHRKPGGLLVAAPQLVNENPVLEGQVGVLSLKKGGSPSQRVPGHEGLLLKDGPQLVPPAPIGRVGVDGENGT
jgi:hypothetical protein